MTVLIITLDYISSKPLVGIDDRSLLREEVGNYLFTRDSQKGYGVINFVLIEEGNTVHLLGQGRFVDSHCSGELFLSAIDLNDSVS